MTAIPKFTDPKIAAKFLNDSDFVSECVPCFVWDTKTDMAATVMPGGSQHETLQSLRVISRADLLAEANKCLGEIIPFITVPGMDITNDHNEEVVRLLNKWFEDWR